MTEVPVTAADLRLQPANNSPTLAVDPTDERFVVLANRLDNPDFSCALHASGDAGRTWEPAAPVRELPEGVEKCYAPEVAFDREGVLYYLFVGLAGRGNQPVGAFIVTSHDRAQSFGAPRRVLGPRNYMVRMAIDPERGEHGRLHLVWLSATTDPPLGGLPPPPNPILTAYSDDGGATFSEPVQVGGERDRLAVAPALAVGTDGRVHILYFDLEEDMRDYAGLAGPTWDGTWSLVAVTSHSGGERFEPPEIVDDAIVPTERVMVIFTMTPPAVATDDSGRVFAAWSDARAGNADVYVARSSGGVGWGRPVRLGDRSARDQYMPRLSAAPGGRLDAVFYDRRDDPLNVRNDVYYTYSEDGGTTFRGAVKVTSMPSDSRIGTTYAIPSAEGLVEFGSRLALASGGDNVLAAWTDTRNNLDTIQQDIFATTIEFDDDGRPWIAPVAGGTTAALLVGAVAWRYRRRRSREAPT